MAKNTISLPEVDEAQITLVMDNNIDLLMASSDVAKRFPLNRDLFNRLQLMAEHGFSALIRVKKGSKSGAVLFDTGVTKRGTLNNLDALELKITDIQAIILSHGHADHALGLPGLIERVGKRNLALVLHPEAYLERKVILPNGTEINLPPPRKTDLLQENIEIIEEVGPSMLIDGLLLISGEIARTTDFEKGFPIHYCKKNSEWKPDPLIVDDQCAIMNVRDKGLVIVTGCGHSGIINIVRNAQKLTGIEKIHAVVGGFHLSGALFEPIVPATTSALQQLNPRYVMPGHCTGWSAVHQIARAMPDAFIPNSVGTTLVL